MRPTTLKSKKDIYTVDEVTIQNNGVSVKYFMKLIHEATQIRTSGVLVIPYKDVPGKLKRSELETIQSKAVANVLTSNLLSTSREPFDINELIRRVATTYSKGYKGLENNIQKHLSIDKSKHRKLTNI